MSKSELQMLCVLPWSGKDEDWQMWSMKFHMCGMCKGYNSVMDGTVNQENPSKYIKSYNKTILIILLYLFPTPICNTFEFKENWIFR